ncbi:MAG: hydrogen peroxide-dependent heme synthase [Planctomycetota bacterium]
MALKSAEDLNLTTEQLTPEGGWHCGHFFFRFDRAKIASLSKLDVERFEQVLDPQQESAPARLQLGVVSGHKADFSIMVMDPDPIKVESINQQLLATDIGQALIPSWSYVSISEISEYVQSVDQYRERLVRSGEDPTGTSIETKVEAYAKRLVKMNYQRLTPDFPGEKYPVSCFYPMNKWRYPNANWFTLASSERNKLMSEHARSGMKFAGKVSQLITVGVGLDDWEWGVTLWAANPLYLKQIVYEMRFDEASAKYAEFGPFYTSYLATARQILESCQLI